MVVERHESRIESIKFQMVAKIGVSILFGLLAFLLTLALGSRASTSIILGIGVSVFIGGLAFVTQFLMDEATRIDMLANELGKLEHGFGEHVNTTRRMIRAEFTKINDATELFGLVEASALKTDAMTQLVRNATTIQQNTPSLVFDFAQAEIARLSGYLKDLGQGGDVTYEGEDRDWLLGLTKVASLSIDATSLTTVDAGGRGFVDGGLWSSDLGHLYLEAQREAIKRGVSIRRIFIMDRPDLEDDKDFVEILRQHAAIGVQVRILKPNEIAITRRASLFDFIVIDGVLSYQATTASRTTEQSRPIIITTTLVTNGIRVQERIERFKDLWASGQEFVNPSKIAAA
jgi:hypothetical protein